MNLQDRLESLKKQRELFKENFIKVLGAIELVESLIEDEKKKKPKK